MESPWQLFPVVLHSRVEPISAKVSSPNHCIITTNKKRNQNNKKKPTTNSIIQLCFFGYKVGWTISQLFIPTQKTKPKTKCQKAEGSWPPFSLLKSRNRNEQSFLHQNSPSLIYYITRTGDYLYRCTMVFILTLYTKFTFKLDLYYRK